MGSTILLADDSLTIQKVVELTFADSDHDVVAVSSGEDLLERLPELRPDLVICDIIMPGKDGYDVCKEIKSNPATLHLPVILLSGTFEPFDRDRALAAGCSEIITKPFEARKLVEAVERLLAGEDKEGVAAPPEVESETSELDGPAATVVAASAGHAESPSEPSEVEEGWQDEKEPDHGLEFTDTGFAEMEEAGLVQGEVPGALPDDGLDFEFSDEHEAFGSPPSTSEGAPVPVSTATADSEPETGDPPYHVETGPAEPFPATGLEPQVADRDLDPFATPPESDAAPQTFEDEPFVTSESSASSEPTADLIAPPSELDSPPRTVESDSESIEGEPETDDSAELTDEFASSSPELEHRTSGIELDEEAPSWRDSSADTGPLAADPSTPSVAAEVAAAGDERSPVAAPPDPSGETFPETEEPERLPEAGAYGAATPPPTEHGLSDEDVDRIAHRLLELAADRIEQIAWEVVPDMAEILVRERIRQLEAESGKTTGDALN